MDSPNQLLLTAKALGQRHVGYGVNPDFHYEITGNAIYSALEDTLGSKFTKRLKDNYNIFYEQIHKVMTTGHFKGPKPGDKISNFSIQEIILITDAWVIAKTKWDEMGDMIYRNFFDNDPLSLQLFSFKDNADIFEST